MNEEEIDDEEYAQVQQSLLIISRIVNDMNLDSFIRRIDKADAMGPILNPTLYRVASGNLQKLRRLACKLRDFQQEVHSQAGHEQADSPNRGEG